jgi:hypothetical protein
MAEIDVDERLAAEWGELLTEIAAETAAAPVDVRRSRPGPEALFAELEETRGAWADLLASAAVANSLDRLATAQWRLRDFLAHLASWAREFRREVEAAVEGAAPDYEIAFDPGAGPGEWNREQVAARRDTLLGQVASEFEGETVRLQDLVLGLEREDLLAEARFALVSTAAGRPPLLRSIAEAVQAKCAHDRHHLDGIRRRLEEWAAEEQEAES